MFATRAPLIAAQFRPLEIADAVVESDVSLVILTGMMRQFQATPDTPTPLLDAAAAVPATEVPCPRTSLTLELFATTLRPGTRFGARSGCEVSTPLSRMAMMMLLLPCVMSHAAGQLIRASSGCQFAYQGSLGTVSGS